MPPRPAHRRRPLLTLSLAATAVLATLPTQAQNALAALTQSKQVRIAIPTDHPPYGLVGADLQPQGLDISASPRVRRR